MGILRGIGKFFGGFLFSTLLAIAILTLSLAQLTEYNTLKPMVVDVFGRQVTQEIDPAELSIIHTQLVELCRNKETIEVSLGGKNITMNCSEITKGRPEDLGKLAMVSIFDETYYKKYDCEFLECLQKKENTERAMVLFSAMANSYFKEILNYLLIGIAIGAIILAASTKGWGRPKSFGICCISAGIPFFVINIVKGMLPISKEAIEITGPIIEQILNSISIKFLIVFVVGVVLFAIGFVGEFLTKKKIKKK